MRNTPRALVLEALHFRTVAPALCGTSCSDCFCPVPQIAREHWQDAACQMVSTVPVGGPSFSPLSILSNHTVVCFLADHPDGKQRRPDAG
jgi:hypothetical protein